MIPLPNAAQVAAMPIEEFRWAGLVAHVWSDALGCEILLASDNAPPGKLKGFPVYQALEMLELAKDPPAAELLRTTNAVKDVFGGMIVENRK